MWNTYSTERLNRISGADSGVQVATKKKYGCLKCHIQLDDIDSVKDHVREVHKKKFEPRYKTPVSYTVIAEGTVILTEDIDTDALSVECHIELDDTDNKTEYDREVHIKKEFRYKTPVQNSESTLESPLIEGVGHTSSKVTLPTAVTKDKAVLPIVKPKHKCGICGKYYTKLRPHVYQTHEEIKCPDCPKHFTRKNLIRHRLLEHGGTSNNKKARISYNCPNCDEIFTTKTSKKYHLFHKHGMEEVEGRDNETILRISKYTCDICNRNFTTRSGITTHMSFTHMNQERLNPKIAPKYRCDVCEKNFANKNALIYHRLSRHRFVKCPECSKSIIKRKLLRHRYEEHGVAIPTCGVCDYKHPSKSVLIRHQRNVHLKEKTVSCPHCEDKFFSNVQLKRHMICHGTKKMHECSYCHKKFPRKCTMIMHERIHTGEKNKVCAVCGDRFVQKASLNYHMTKHHPEAC